MDDSTQQPAATGYIATLLDYLVSEMERRSWSPADLARASGLSPGAVGNILHRRRNPSNHSLTSIAGALDIPAEQLLRLAGELPDSESNPILERLVHLASQLPHREQEELVEYVRWRLRRCA